MFIVTHTEQNADAKTGREKIPAGLLFPNRDEYAEAVLEAGIADERIVRCTRKHYFNEPVTVCYRERQVIDNVDHALRALATGKAVLEPPLGESIQIAGVVVSGKFHPLDMFMPEPAPKPEKKSAPGQATGKPESKADNAGGDQPSA